MASLAKQVQIDLKTLLCWKNEVILIEFVSYSCIDLILQHHGRKGLLWVESFILLCNGLQLEYWSFIDITSTIYIGYHKVKSLKFVLLVFTTERRDSVCWSAEERSGTRSTTWCQHRELWPGGRWSTDDDTSTGKSAIKIMIYTVFKYLCFRPERSVMGT